MRGFVSRMCNIYPLVGFVENGERKKKEQKREREGERSLVILMGGQ